MSQTVTPGDTVDPGAQFEPYRRELTAFSYRMLGSAFEAEDAVQETLLRAWRGFEGFEGRASVRSWLYRIATNVCLDMARGRTRRARPMDLGPAGATATAQLVARPHEAWLEPMPERLMLGDTLDPADVAAARESVRLAFVAALQHLPARQRAVLILREVLRWPATEVAELLDTTVASVNSALQRARATLADGAVAETDVWRPLDPEQQALLGRYVAAFEAYDLDALTALLHADVVQTMPPYDLWLTGHDEIRRWYLGPGIGCRGSRLVPVVANGSAAFGQYKPGPDGDLEPWAVQVIEIREGAIAAMNAFLDTERLFPLFGLPPRLDR
ncbi:MAG TPA: sigma-70 family RNA polymerase sigma factor [Egibacteraceae bacterium]|nr:sigma-70 family RNA polymerase sigma factor [Egibacteraceae bacterium]